jgi:Pentapeptide repeats (8 copies)
MANEHHLRILGEGVAAWNEWRRANPKVVPDLNAAELQWTNLHGADLSRAEMELASCMGADLTRANLSHAELTGIKLNDARLPYAKLVHSTLRKAYFWGSDLRETDFSQADLTGANLMCTQLVKTNFNGANLSGCKVFGASAWDVQLDGANQTNLVVTHPNHPAVTVDNLEVAQFIYLLLHNEKIRGVIDTITSKAVLILGRFTAERKKVLDAIREELRREHLVPLLFDFNTPESRDVTETVSTLAHMARFIIADITDAKSIPQELQRIVPDLPSVPVQPLLQASSEEYGMFEHFKRYPWVLAIHRYRDLPDLLSNLSAKVIVPAEAKAKELNPRIMASHAGSA